MRPDFFHTLPCVSTPCHQGMEARKPCVTREFHTFHTFHTCGPPRMHMGGRARRVYARVVFLIQPLEGMEGMEEAGRARLYAFHTCSTPL